MALFWGTSRRSRTVRMLGTHGVPAQYGGFETAVEHIGLHLAQSGWRVIVYCQVEGKGPIVEDTWRGIERVLIPIDLPDWRGTFKFDLLSVAHAARHDDICLVFGYNTALLNVVQRLTSVPLVINMDGIEWSRQKWNRALKAVLYANERIGCMFGNELIADHPEIETYLRRRARDSKITMITYGADSVTTAPTEPALCHGLTPGEYLSLICRPVPENSILEIVRGFSARRRGVRLAILGDYDPKADDYQRRVVNAASDEVVFLGSIYDPEVTRALRYHSLGYLHGHTVGGTNPSLVEAMAAGNPIIAHDNPYNRWVAGESGLYFRTPEDVDRQVDRLISDCGLARQLSMNARARHAEQFTWEHISAQYEQVLSKYVPSIEPSPSMIPAMEI